MILNETEALHCGEVALELAQWAVPRILAHHGGDVATSTKTTPFDWVTATDVAIETYVRRRLNELFPDYGVVGEEMGESLPRSGMPTWYLDPVDGTTNLVSGIPWSSFSLAVVDEAGIAAGVVADPYRAETFSAVRGTGARCNGVRLRCRDVQGMLGEVVLTELMGVDLWPGMAQTMEYFQQQGCATRILGSSALTLASVGAGRAAAAVLGSYHPIDVAAGLLVAREAGAVIRAGRADQVLSTEVSLRHGAMVVAAPGAAGEVLAALGEAL